MSKKIKNIIAKYFTNSATITDLDILSDWVKKSENKKIFDDYVQTHYAINHVMNNEDSGEVIKKLLRTIRKEKSLVFKLKNQPIYKFVAAASILIVVALTIFLNKGNDVPQFVEPIIITNQIEAGTDKATLTLEDGENIALIKGTSFQTPHATSNGEEITYNNNSSHQLIYNYLTIPRGGQFQITLSDGTKVWLNSDTRLKYPVNFSKEQTRQVELIYGEAYFDVVSSTDANKTAFQVIVNNQKVDVRGTEFNVKAYREDNSTYTTLVEGEVVVSNSLKSIHLVPSQQSITTKNTDSIMVNQVDAYDVISWKKGVFSFDGKTLKEIMNAMERWYDVKVIFENKSLEDIKFVGVFVKNQNIEHILRAIKNTTYINDYEINNKTISIK